MRLKLVAMDENMDMACDGPDLTPTSSPTALRQHPEPELDIPAVADGVSGQSQASANGFRESDASGGMLGSDGLSGGRRKNEGSLDADSGSADAKPCQPCPDKPQDQEEGEASAVSPSTDSSAASSLCMDGGGEQSAVEARAVVPQSAATNNNDIFVVLCRNMLLQDVEEPSVFVVDFTPAVDVLENASRTGSFAGIRIARSALALR